MCISLYRSYENVYDCECFLFYWIAIGWYWTFLQFVMVIIFIGVAIINLFLLHSPYCNNLYEFSNRYCCPAGEQCKEIRNQQDIDNCGTRYFYYMQNITIPYRSTGRSIKRMQLLIYHLHNQRLLLILQLNIDKYMNIAEFCY